VRPARISIVLAAGFVLALAVGSSSAIGVSNAASKPALPPLPTKPMSAADRARISAVVRDVLRRDQYKAEVPGLLVGIWSPTQGVYRASFGRADPKSAAKPKLASSFRIGSVSKTFTATVVLQLVDEGKLRLNGTVKQYVPALARKYPAIGRRTVAQLLGMRSGLPEYADAASKVFTRATQRVWTANEAIALGMRSGPVKPAGGRTSAYSNTNYVILGQIAQSVTRTPFPRLIRERLLAPLGLRHTVYPAPTDVRLPAPFTRGYVGPSGAEEITKLGGAVSAGTDVTRWNPSWGNAAGMMISTIDDLARWGNGLSGNALLSPKLGKLRLAATPMNESFRYGLGILTLTGGRWTGHEGGIPGWSTWALKDTKSGTVVVTSINACCGGAPAAVTFELLQRLYPETFVIGRPLPGGTPYQLSETTSFTPPPGWTIDTSKTVEGLSLTAVKPGVVFDLSDAIEIPAGQTFASWTALLRDSEVAPGTTVSPLIPFATTDGQQGATYTTRSETQSTRTWFVTNGKKIARLTVRGSAASVNRVTQELDRMARSIRMTAP
jgi:D-alanyl-D-alanine carboxypeptidase